MSDGRWRSHAAFEGTRRAFLMSAFFAHLLSKMGLVLVPARDAQLADLAA